MVKVESDYQLTPYWVFGAIGPFSDELIMAGTEGLLAAVKRLESLKPLDAVRLLLASTLRSDAVIDVKELEALADYLGVFEDDE